MLIRSIRRQAGGGRDQGPQVLPCVPAGDYESTARIFAGVRLAVPGKSGTSS